MKNVLVTLGFLFVTLFSSVLCADELGITKMNNWAYKQIVKWSPPGKSHYTKETQSDAEKRYSEIASDAVAVVYDPNEPSLFKGENGRARTLALLLSVASSESDFRSDVDTGVGRHSKGDGGKSWCLMQVQLSKAGKDGKTSTRVLLDPDGGFRFSYDPKEGLGGEDLVKDRKMCFRVALRMMKRSFETCVNNPESEKLAAYTAGNCEKGKNSSRRKYNRAASIFESFYSKDSEVVIR